MTATLCKLLLLENINCSVYVNDLIYVYVLERRPSANSHSIFQGRSMIKYDGSFEMHITLLNTLYLLKYRRLLLLENVSELFRHISQRIYSIRPERVNCQRLRGGGLKIISQKYSSLIN